MGANTIDPYKPNQSVKTNNRQRMKAVPPPRHQHRGAQIVALHDASGILQSVVVENGVAASYCFAQLQDHPTSVPRAFRIAQFDAPPRQLEDQTIKQSPDTVLRHTAALKTIHHK